MPMPVNLTLAVSQGAVQHDSCILFVLWDVRFLKSSVSIAGERNQRMEMKLARFHMVEHMSTAVHEIVNLAPIPPCKLHEKAQIEQYGKYFVASWGTTHKLCPWPSRKLSIRRNYEKYVVLHEKSLITQCGAHCVASCSVPQKLGA